MVQGHMVKVHEVSVLIDLRGIGIAWENLIFILIRSFQRLALISWSTPPPPPSAAALIDSSLLIG